MAALAELKLVLKVDGQGQVTGALNEVGAAGARAGQTIQTATSRAAAGLIDMETATGRAAAGNDRVIASLAGYAASVFGIYAVGSAIKTLVTDSLDYQAKIETANLGIASSFLVGGQYIDNTTGKVLQGQKAMQAAQDDAAHVMDQLKVANMETIATLDQLVRAYQETLPVAMAKGFNRDQVMQFTQAMVQAAGAIGLPFDQMGEETRSLLTGTINPRTSRIATVLGLRNEDIAPLEGNATALFDFLMQKLDGYRIAGIESQKTWAGLWSNWKDIQGQALGMGTQPLFDAIKAELSDITKQIVTIDEKTRTIKWNPEFLSFIDDVKDKITSVIAEIYRMNMLLDKAGGTKTTLDMFGSGIGSALGISRNEHPFLAMLFGSKEEFEEAAKNNIEYADRYLANDKKLQELANRAAGLDANGNPLKKATSNSTYNSNPQKAEDTNVLTDDYLRTLRQAQEQYFTYSKAFDDRVLAGIRNSTALQLAALDDRHSQGLISEQDYLNSHLALEKLGLNQELAQLNDRFDKIKTARDAAAKANAKPVGYDSEGTPLYNAERLATEIKTETDYQNILKERQGLQAKIAQAEQKYSLDSAANIRNLAKEYANLDAEIKRATGDSLGATMVQTGYNISELQRKRNGIMDQGPPSATSAQQILNINKQISIEQQKQAQELFNQQKAQVEIAAQLLEQQGLIGQATALRNSIKPLDPSQMGINPVTKSLQDMADALKEVVDRFNELHRNDTIKFQIEDIGIDQFTKRARDIEREYSKTTDLITAKMAALSKDDSKYTEQRDALSQDYNLADQKRAAETAQLKKDMLENYVSVAGNLMGNLAASMDQTNRQQFEAAKALNIGQTIMNTAAAVMQAMANLPPPASYIAAAIAAATGALQINKILSTQYGSTASASVSAGVSSGSFAGSGYSSSQVGGSIGSQYQSLAESQSQESLRQLATAADSASLALTKVSDGLTKIADLFKDGSFMSLAAGAAPNQTTALTSAPESGFLKGVRPFSDQLLRDMWSKPENILHAAMTADPVFNAGIRAIFGGGWNATGSGVQLGIQDGAVTAKGYTTWHKDGGWFGSDQDRTDYTSSPGFQSAVQGAVDSIVATINRAAVVMGTSVDTSLVNLAPTNIATAGRSASDIQKDLQAWLEKVSNEMAKNVTGLAEFAFYGENAFDALVRLSTALQTVSGRLNEIGSYLTGDGTLAGANAAYKLQDLMGGADAFNKSIDTYVSSMYTDTEQKALKATVAQQELNAAFAEMHRSVPATRDEFRNLVNSLDVTTEYGAKTFAALMSVAEAFGTVQDQIDAVKKATDDLSNNLDVRTLKAQGQSDLADILQLQIDQQKELADAQAQGLDTTRLQQVQQLEFQQKLNELQGNGYDQLKTKLQDVFTLQINAATALKGIITDNASPEQNYLGQKASITALLAQGQAGDATAAANFISSAQDFLNTSKTYNASGSAYQADVTMIKEALASFAGMTTGDPTLDAVQQQLTTLQSIQTAINNGATAQITALQNLLTESTATKDLLAQYLTQAPTTGSDAVATYTAAKTAWDQAQQNYNAGKANIAAETAQAQAASDPYTNSIYYSGGAGFAAGYYNKDALIGGDYSVLKYAQMQLDKDLEAARQAAIAAGVLPKFALGGISNGPSIFGEAGPEAAVPLPDGRTIPVTIFRQTQTADNSDVVSELRAMRQEIAALRAENKQLQTTVAKISQAGFKTLAKQGEDQAADTAVINSKVKLAASK